MRMNRGSIPQHHHPGGPLLSRQQAADYLCLPVSYLESRAKRGEGPAFYQPSARRTFYRLADLDRWMADCRRGPAAA